MRLLVCGDRNWTDANLLFASLDKIHEQTPISWLIHGNCRGADKMAMQWASDRDIPMIIFPADWAKFGRAAGPIRNQLQLDSGRPDAAIAFHDNLDESTGTADMVSRCRKAGVSCQVVGHMAGGVSVQTIKPRSGFAV